MTSPRAHSQYAFGLLETSIITIVIGVMALFAIPRYEARAETPVALEALRYANAIGAQQAVQLQNKSAYAAHLGQIESNPVFLWRVPSEFLVDEFTADSNKEWRMVIKRRALDCVFGDYTIVWDENGFNRKESSIPPALVEGARELEEGEKEGMWALETLVQESAAATQG